jgi:hypothetical protein
MGRTTGQWRCRICSFDRRHIVTVKRKNRALYTDIFLLLLELGDVPEPGAVQRLRECGAEAEFLDRLT